MNRGQHTPKPWTVATEARGRTLVRGDDGGLLAQVNYGWYGDQMSAANALLIAAAPDLLDELINVLHQAEANPSLAVGMLVEHYSNLRQVLSEATGGQSENAA